MGSPIREIVCTQLPTEIILIFVNIEHCKTKNLNVPSTTLINSTVMSIITLSKKPKSMKVVLTVSFMKHYAFTLL